MITLPIFFIKDIVQINIYLDIDNARTNSYYHTFEPIPIYVGPDFTYVTKRFTKKTNSY